MVTATSLAVERLPGRPWENRAAVPGTGTLYLGTSGYAYDEWKNGVFYPEGLKAREMLPYFASRFRSVEINYTFRHHPSEKTLQQWRALTPEGFAFTLKAHQNITHRQRLADAGEAVSFFVERARQLGDRLGTILFQCPPSLRFERERTLGFLSVLPPGGRYAMEFRHPSWEEARPLLVEHGVAWCMAETDDTPAGPDAFEPFGYLRLRKEAYPDEEIAEWAARAGAALEAGHDVYCYFKHEEKGIGPAYALRLAELLAASPTASP
jgi:uncharacterized protein YecE (DUF72 family)